MMRFVLLAAMVACAAAGKGRAPRQRNKGKKFEQMVDPYVEGLTAQPPTGVFIKGASFPIPRSSEGFIALDLTTIEAYLSTPSLCPQTVAIGDAVLTIRASENKCDMTANFVDQESETGSTKETITGEFAWFSASCLWEREGVQYQLSIPDILSEDTVPFNGTVEVNPLTNNTGYMSVSQGGNNCLQPVATTTADLTIGELHINFEAIDTNYGQLTVHQTTQGYYRLDGEMMLGTGGPSISQDFLDSTVKVDLKKHTGAGLTCPKGPLGEILFGFQTSARNGGRPVTPLQEKKGYRGCASIVGLGGSQYGGLFSDFGLDRMDKISLYAFDGLAPWYNENGIKVFTPFVIVMFQIDYEADAWVVLTVTDPQINFANDTYHLLDIGDVLALGDRAAELNCTEDDIEECFIEYVSEDVLANDISVNVYIRIARPESSLEMQNLKNKETVYNGSNSALNGANPKAGYKKEKKYSYSEGNKKQNRRKRRRARNQRKASNNLDF